MNAGESLSTPAQLVPPLFVPSFCARAHASLHLSFPFSTPRCYVSPQGRWRTRGEPVFRGRCTHMVANEQMGWDRRHRIYCVTSYPLPTRGGSCSRYSLASSRFTLAHFHHRLSSRPSTSNPGQTSADRMSFHLLPSHSCKSSPLRDDGSSPPRLLLAWNPSFSKKFSIESRISWYFYN